MRSNQVVVNVARNNCRISFRTNVLSFGERWLNKVTQMDDGEAHEENHIEKVPVLNTIFEDLISDASDLVKDLSWGVKTYLLFGLISILFGIQQLVYNLDVLQEQLYIPAVIAGIMMFSGTAQILNFVRLRKKYSRLFKVQEEFKKA
jgi:hypothetical protein